MDKFDIGGNPKLSKWINHFNIPVNFHELYENIDVNVVRTVLLTNNMVFH